MPLVPAGHIVQAASAGRHGAGAFNVITLEHAEAIVAGAEAAAQPVILQISQNCVRFHGALRPVARAAAEVAKASAVDVGLHLDHIEDGELPVRRLVMRWPRPSPTCSACWPSAHHDNRRAAAAVAAAPGRACRLMTIRKGSEPGGRVRADDWSPYPRGPDREGSPMRVPFCTTVSPGRVPPGLSAEQV